MPNLIASATTVSNGTIKKNNFLIGVNTSVQYGPTSSTGFWNGVVPPSSGYTVYEQKSVNGPSIRTAANDSELITIAKQYGGTNITTIYDALNYFNGQSNYMVTNIDYPNIVTSGLSMILDSGYIPSYPTTGTTCTDLSGKGLDSSVPVNTYSSTNSGIFNFDGTTTSLTTSAGYPSTNTLTIQMWIKSTSFGGLVGLITSNGWATGYVHFMLNGANIDFAMNANSPTDQIFSYTLSTNTWYNIAVTYDVPAKTVSLYVNGSFSSTLTYSAVGSTSQQPLNIGSWSGSRYFTGSMGPISIYNRVLSATEVLQNYNAFKSRYGL